MGYGGGLLNLGKRLKAEFSLFQGLVLYLLDLIRYLLVRPVSPTMESEVTMQPVKVQPEN